MTLKHTFRGCIFRAYVLFVFEIHFYRQFQPMNSY